MIYPVNYIVFDCETGGLNPQKNPIIEIALYVINNDLEYVAEYETLVKPYGDLIYTPQAMEVHKIPMEQILSEGKDIKLVVKEMIDFIKPLKLGKFAKPIFVGHNIYKFDGPYLESVFSFCGKSMFDVVENHYEDTMWIARKKWGNKEQIANFQLTTCCNKVGIEFVQAHRAMTDTKATARLFMEFVKDLRSEGTTKKQERVREKFKF